MNDRRGCNKHHKITPPEGPISHVFICVKLSTIRNQARAGCDRPSLVGAID